MSNVGTGQDGSTPFGAICQILSVMKANDPDFPEFNIWDNSCSVFVASYFSAVQRILTLKILYTL
jgi:hypothetical protein